MTAIAEPVDILGSRVHPMAISQWNSVVAAAIERNDRCVIASHNLHSLYLFHRNANDLQSFYRRVDYAHIDGMSVVLLGRLLGVRVDRAHRVAILDWFDPLLTEAVRRQWRVFYVGSRPGVAEKAAQRLRESYPGLQIATAHGYVDAPPDGQNTATVLARIKEFQPQVVMVGMGQPKQELWIHKNLSEISSNVIITTGALLDYIAGEVALPPRWLGKIGMEWAYRLYSEPRRLSFRYLVEPWFVLRVLIHEWCARLFSLGRGGDASVK
jgi:N-acetylglucosaminyldiphosphoundecaprenol N-acetyl-beta-D-mannosaminyltransferase